MSAQQHDHQHNEPNPSTSSNQQQDQDELLFAELDRELEEMEDQENYPHLGQQQRQQQEKETSYSSFEEKDGEQQQQQNFKSFDLADFRERRIQELREEMLRKKKDKESLENSNLPRKGQLLELGSEKDLIHLTAREKTAVIHFYHKDFERCKILNRHLEVLARTHPETLFVKASVLECPFLVQKLEIKVLPCLVSFKDGVSKDKMIGFEEIGNTDKFATGALEWRLGRAGVLDPRRNEKPILGFGQTQSQGVGAGVMGASTRHEDDFDDGWDD
ncbi:thioredoxin-like protein [Violaceomyces palustris]|uniref:Thioredoxin-like protein n=1 Tax=Violaceomyces palustris TaxID=1673888 RepID=A0ACD0NWV3_9BASI|nr:thioredoxin-like protein [Violaceomyces palustris]